MALGKLEHVWAASFAQINSAHSRQHTKTDTSTRANGRGQTILKSATVVDQLLQALHVEQEK